MKNCIYTIVLSIFCLASCITAKCPGYDLSDFQQISFRKGDTLTYVSNQLDTIRLNVSDFHTKGPYEFSSYPDYECDYDTYYQTAVQNGISIKEHITYNMSIKFCDDNEYEVTFSDHTEKNNYKVEVTDTLLNGTICDKYLIKDLSFNRRIDACIKVDFCGIIEFHDKVTDLTWRQIR
ncbi:hypothetical protein D0T50_12325 [Bacteroides sp. 214]|uniref:hypothetical protein n=1 Tax=Bacteroides sp. 214 TaxID=2302935 RepID=UPI0013CF8857|nr:hypothetical protein [Bacteroides sp. 214]NDW13670.1 hypothetical protein [Bacteroides sp. 214]